MKASNRRSKLGPLQSSKTSNGNRSRPIPEAIAAVTSDVSPERLFTKVMRMTGVAPLKVKPSQRPAGKRQASAARAAATAG